MSKFDTHGGYFSPKDYLRVNEGGSHEENPNGGVQLGVDPEGNPNLLEEGEPVYKDYVYSDNIEADEKFLVDNNLPKKYAGKLYSKIADDFVTEAEERPLDPISRNGLEVMLGRLADAQEGQKQAKEQADLEAELSNLSPEELDQLEAMLAQGEQPMVPEQEMMPEEQMGPAMPMEQAPVMACGGKMRFNGGGLVPTISGTDPFLTKRYPYPPSPGHLLAWGLEHGDDEYPRTFIDRAKAAISTNKLREAKKKEERQREWESTKLYKALDRFDDKYLDDMWLHPLPDPNEKLFHVFDDGGDVPLKDYVVPETDPNELGHDVETALSYAPPSLLTLGARAAVSGYNNLVDNTRLGSVLGSMMPEGATQAFAPLGRIGKAAKSAYSAADVGVQVGKWSTEVSEAQRAFEAAEKVFKTGKDAAGNSIARDVAKAGLEQAKKKLKFAKRELSRWSGMIGEAPKTAEAASSAAESATEAAAEATETAAKTFNGKKFVKTAIGTGLGATGLGLGYEYLYKPIAKDIYDHQNQEPYIFALPDSTSTEGAAVTAPSDTIKIGSSVDLSFLDEEPEYKACGGHINKFDKGGWGEFLDTLWNYKESLKPSAAAGKYAIDRAGTYWGGRTGRQVESDPNYDAFTQYVLSHGDDPYVQRYLRALDVGVNKDKGVPLLWDAKAGKLVDDWARLYKERRTDGDLGIYHITPEDLGFLTAPAAPAATAQNPQNVDTQYEFFPGQFAALQYGKMIDNLSPRNRYAMFYKGEEPGSGVNANSSSDEPTFIGGMIEPAAVTPKKDRATTNMLPTWPRYAGAIGSGLLGLYNVFQQPDKYRAPRINPQLPEGRIHLQNQVYTPIDQNMIANAQIAQGNATNRALRNSGLGPSSAAAILAADNNTTGNLGTGFIQAWDANNQRKNAVIAANNQAEAQRAQFDYNVDAARKQILNNIAYFNGQNDLMTQRLNNAAEGEKYQAISNQIANGLQALSGIGQENFAMNQINSNPAFLGYHKGPDGSMYYLNPKTGRLEKVNGKDKS